MAVSRMQLYVVRFIAALGIPLGIPLSVAARKQEALGLCKQADFGLTLYANKNTLQLTIFAYRLKLSTNSSQTRFSAQIKCK